MSFTTQVRSWTVKAGDNIEELRKNVMLELFSSVILDTPVLEGRLRGNWTISSGSPETAWFNLVDKDGNETIHKVKDHIKNLPPRDQSVFLANNLPYAHTIEFDGWSKKAPEGMVRKNFIRISNNLKRNG
ncbi:HK97 gp10 family phage protein [Gammaproteobacteria bacterium]|nr:HK97 gp10 family phage protein [Gammaproteobacteria bacterium]